MPSQSVWGPLAEGKPIRTCSIGQMIYLQGTEAHEFYYVISGTVKCYISSPQGDERTLALHHGGELIGEASFFDRKPRVSSAVAVTPCQLVKVDRAHLEVIFSEHPHLAIHMLEYLARTIRLLSVHVDGNFLKADQRVARYLLSQRQNKEGEISCTHEEIGGAIGASRVTVSRVLGEFERSGLVKTGYRTVTILEYKTLDDMIQNSR